MSNFYQTVISIISKPSEKRKDEEIHMILAWFINLFKKKASVFGEVNSEVIKDIIKNCSFETKKKDEIIIRQGDVGDCFYINLRGKVSIYINHKKYDENDNIDDTDQSIDENSIDSSHINHDHHDHRNMRLRERLGNYVTSLGPGEGFGEIALVSDDTRSASIIADETTDLMVVNKVLYARCLQAPTQRKLNEKHNFINSSPFFGNWAPKMKKLLSLCLERDIIPYDSYLIKQGETAEKIFFIIKGSAKIAVNPSIHSSQYPRLHPLKLPENAEAEIISSWIDEKNAILNQTVKTIRTLSSKLNSQNNSQVIKRRNETFAEAEQRLKIKNVEIGILGPGEVIGMCEIIFDMPSYMQSVKCLEDCDVYFIYKRSYERLIAKRNPNCINKMKENVYMKLVDRNNRLKNTIPIDLYRSIQYKIELSNRRKSSAEKLQDQIKTQSKGPIIQFDLKSKKAAYERIKRLHNRNSQDKNRNSALQQAEEFNKLNIEQQNDDSLNEHQTKFNDEINNLAEELKQDNLSANSIENSVNEQALEELEERIKKWHLDFGIKKAQVPKLNRIDIDKIKNDVKIGGNIFIKKHRMLNDLKNRVNKSNRSSCSETSSENNSSENELEFPMPTRIIKPMIRVDPRMKSDYKGDLINSYIAYVDTGDSNESYDSIEQQNEIYRNLSHSNLVTSTHDQHGCILTVPAYLNFKTPVAQNHGIPSLTRRRNSCLPNPINVVSTIELPSNDYLNKKRISLPAKLVEENENLNETNNIHQKQDYNSSNNTNNSNTTFTMHSLLTENSENATNDSLIRRKSSYFGQRNNSTQMTSFMQPYSVRRKFSMGQIKIQHTGKQYSKEEYESLKDELRKQSRRYSLNN